MEQNYTTVTLCIRLPGDTCKYAWTDVKLENMMLLAPPIGSEENEKTQLTDAND